MLFIFFLSCRNNFLGTHKRVRISNGKRHRYLSHRGFTVVFKQTVGVICFIERRQGVMSVALNDILAYELQRQTTYLRTFAHVCIRGLIGIGSYYG